MNSFIQLSLDNIDATNTKIEESLGVIAALLREVEEMRTKNWEELESIKGYVAE